MILTYLIFLLGSIGFSLVLNKILLKFASNLGIRGTHESLVRWSAQSKPAVGGISFYVIFLLSITILPFVLGMPILRDEKFLGIVIACTLAFLMGLADDAYNTKPMLKYAVQILCGLVFLVFGIVIHISPYTWLNNLFTLFWVVGMMNSLNMLDNMDGITTSVSLTILVSAIFLSQLNAQANNTLLLLITVAGTLLGFLYYNWNPSKLFMGDTGSQFLGAFLAGIGIIYFWNSNDAQGDLYPSRQFCISIMTFIIPICDTSIVVINRIYKGSSPFVGGKDHTTHHLSYWGLSDRMVAVSFAAISGVAMALTLFMTSIGSNWGMLQFFVCGGFFLAVFSFLFYVTKTTSPPNKK